jgi:hypothetical protein
MMMWRRLFIVVGILALASVMPVAVATTTASAAPSRASQTAHCVNGVAKNAKVTKSVVNACEGSSLKVTHLCPKGSSTIFVIVHYRTYALRIGHKPERLAKQFGMGAISEACGNSKIAVPTTTAAPNPPTTVPTTVPAPAPSTTTQPPPPPTTAAPASCHPLTDGGNCYEPGEYCRNSDHGVTGVAGDGQTITCEDNNGWRWEPA